MQTHRSNTGTLIGGVVLIAFGLLALAGQVFRDLNWGFFWPFTIIGFGALFFVAMFAGGKQTAGFAIPGSIITGVGLVMLFQNVTRHWASMSYFWTLILLFVGIGIYLMGLYTGDVNQKHSGMRVMKVGFVLFIIFGAFFELVFSGFNDKLFPILLILLGGYLVVTRAGLFNAHKPDASSSLPSVNK